VAKPLISITFDDFPQSAVRIAGGILSEFGLRATYYVSAGLMGKTTAVGVMFDRSDVKSVVETGHELACHTLDHSLCCNLTPRALVESCRRNRDRIAEMANGYSLSDFSFPEGVVTLSAKNALGAVYRTCRTIESGINLDPIDMGFLHANPVYSSTNMENLRALIRHNEEKKGWLILYTHDVTAEPSRWGCTPKRFREVVQCAVQSGAEILPIGAAAERFTKNARGRWN
jgi:peptidoglycan/xylan/chitin deacetylase (PgdA/CDA1 family)